VRSLEAKSVYRRKCVRSLREEPLSPVEREGVTGLRVASAGAAVIVAVHNTQSTHLRFGMNTKHEIKAPQGTEVKTEAKLPEVLPRHQKLHTNIRAGRNVNSLA
jgi:hypothetical protein